MNKRKITSTLLSSISGVLIFLSTSHFIDLNGWSGYAPLLIILGISILYWSDPLMKKLEWMNILTKSLLQAISHILIFVGSKVYFMEFIEEAWLTYFIIGIIFLNNHDKIAQALFKN